MRKEILARKQNNYDYSIPTSTFEERTPVIQPAEIISVDSPKEEIVDTKPDINVLIHYINKEQAKGTSNNNIKLNLMNNAWPKDLVEDAFEKTECSKKLKDLEAYIKTARDAGYSEEIIRYHLIKAEWAEHFIDMVLHEVHILHDDFEKVEGYVKAMISKGYKKDDILRSLMSVGWAEENIAPYFEEEN